MIQPIRSAAAAATLLATSAAMAQAYVGFGAGLTDLDINCATTSSCDTGGTGGKIQGGWKVTPELGLELSRFDFGRATASGPGALSSRIKASGWGVGGAYFMAFTPRWMGAARAGIASNRSDIEGAWGVYTSADAKTRYSLYGGLAAHYLLLPKLSIDAGLDVSRAKYSGEVAYVRLLSLGMTYWF